jgi:hypothetical protein
VCIYKRQRCRERETLSNNPHIHTQIYV